MMKLFKRALLVYNQLLVVVLVVAGISSGNSNLVLPLFLFFPVFLHFISHTVKIFNKNEGSKLYKIGDKVNSLTWAYSLVISCLFFASSLLLVHSIPEALLALVVLPLPTYFILRFFGNRTNTKLAANLLKQNQEEKEVGTYRESIIVSAPKDKIRTRIRLVFEPESISFSSLAVGDEAEQVESTNTETNENQVLLSDYDEAEEVLAEKDPSIKDYDRRQFLKLLGGGSIGLLAMSLFFPQKASAAFFGSAPGPGTVAIKDSSGNQIDPAIKEPTDGYKISELDDTSSPSYYGFLNKDGNWYIAEESASGSYRYIKGASGFTTNWGNRASLSYDTFDNIF